MTKIIAILPLIFFCGCAHSSSVAVALSPAATVVAPIRIETDGVNCGNFKKLATGFSSCGFRVEIDSQGNETIVTRKGGNFAGFPTLNPDKFQHPREHAQAFARFDGTYYLITNDHVFLYRPAADFFTVEYHIDGQAMVSSDAYTTWGIVAVNKDGAATVAGVLYYDREWKATLLESEVQGVPQIIGYQDGKFFIKLTSGQVVTVDIGTTLGTNTP